MRGIPQNVFEREDDGDRRRQRLKNRPQAGSGDPVEVGARHRVSERLAARVALDLGHR
jgi:hypothetical protein